MLLNRCVQRYDGVFPLILTTRQTYITYYAYKPATRYKRIKTCTPNFIEIVALGQTSTVLPGNLGLGERAVIILAFKLNADLVLIDDRAAAAEAAKLGLRVTGTLGIFDQAAKDGLIDFASTVRRLQSTNFRVAPAVIDHLLREHAERRRR